VQLAEDEEDDSGGGGKIFIEVHADMDGEVAREERRKRWELGGPRRRQRRR
jgi:hypothetical protein